MIAAHPTPRRPASARGFALPLVVLFSLVSTLMIAVMLSRQGTQSLTVKREIDAYGSHHLAKGMSEAIQAWTTSVAGGSIAEVLAEDGHAFTLTAGSDALRVSLFEDQGTALGETKGLSPGSRQLADRVLLGVVQAYGPESKAHLRSIGPVAVSVNSAPEPVLFAAIDAVLEGDGTDALTTEIVRARSRNGFVTRDDLLAAFDSARIPSEKRGALDGSITSTPIVWRVVVEPLQRGGAIDVYYEGQALIAPPGSPDRSSLKGWKLDLRRKTRVE